MIERIAFVVLSAIAVGAIAQGYPEKPVRVIVPYVAGGATDIYARLISRNLSELLGRQFVVENRGGAATIVGAQAAAQSAKDGYTLLFTVSATFSANPHLHRTLPYAFSDFAPIAMIGVSSGWTLSVHPSVPARSVREFATFARARPGEIVMGTLGAGSGPYLVAKTFERLAGLKLVEVSYKGSADAMRDLLAGHVMMYSDGLAGALPQHRAGRLRILGITGPKRSPLVPEVATLLENGYAEMVLTNFWAFFAPAGAPQEIIQRLHAAIVKATDNDAFRARLAAEGVVPQQSTPGELSEAVRRDTEIWRRLITSLNIKPE